MSIHTIRDLFLHQLGAAYDVEQQVVGFVDQVEMEALSTDFRDRMRRHRTETLRQIDNLERCFELTGAAPPHVECALVRGMREDRQQFAAAGPSGTALEVFNLHSIDRLAHYKEAMYRLLAELARNVGQDDVRRLLEQNLGDEAALCEWVAEHRDRLLAEAAAPAPSRASATARVAAGNGQEPISAA
jgi:ferritin-like metal-binding protein YciE